MVDGGQVQFTFTASQIIVVVVMMFLDHLNLENYPWLLFINKTKFAQMQVFFCAALKWVAFLQFGDIDVPLRICFCS